MQITPLYADIHRPMRILALASGRGTNFEKIHLRQIELETGRRSKLRNNRTCLFKQPRGGGSQESGDTQNQNLFDKF